MRPLRIGPLFVGLVLTLAACGDDEDHVATSMASTPTSSGNTETGDSSTGDPSTTSDGPTSGVDPATGASDPTGADSPRWEVTVSGGVNDTATGVIVQVNQGFTTVLGGDTDLSATYVQPSDEPTTGEKRLLSFDIDLDDGTECGLQNAGDLEAYINVVDASEGAYDATFSGMILCDGAVEVALSGYIRE